MSKINVPLFRKVQDKIRKNAGRFLMHTWQDTEVQCGTAFCISGWACAIDRRKTGKSSSLTRDIAEALGYDERTEFFCDYGARILGIEHTPYIPKSQSRTPCPRLFVADQWPTRFKRRYLAADMNQFTREFAELGCEVIDDFIATDGWTNVPDNYFSDDWKEPEPVVEEAPAQAPAALPFPVRIPSRAR